MILGRTKSPGSLEFTNALNKLVAKGIFPIRLRG